MPLGVIFGLIYRFRVKDDHVINLDYSNCCSALAIVALKLVNAIIIILLPLCISLFANIFDLNEVW